MGCVLLTNLRDVDLIKLILSFLVLLVLLKL